MDKIVIEKNKRGRKPKHLVNILKTKVWVEYLIQTAKMGVDSLEIHIGVLTNEIIDKPYRLRRYKIKEICLSLSM